MSSDAAGLGEEGRIRIRSREEALRVLAGQSRHTVHD